MGSFFGKSNCSCFINFFSGGAWSCEDVYFFRQYAVDQFAIPPVGQLTPRRVLQYYISFYKTAWLHIISVKRNPSASPLRLNFFFKFSFWPAVVMEQEKCYFTLKQGILNFVFINLETLLVVPNILFFVQILWSCYFNDVHIITQRLVV